jgi:hypothetical protein
VLDDIKWAIMTQFRAHYNASHPIVQRNIRRNINENEIENYQYKDVRITNPKYFTDIANDIPGRVSTGISTSTYYNDNLTNEEYDEEYSKKILQDKIGGIVTHDEFLKKVPRYPNDGVLLLDVKKYNSRNILSNIDAIAAGNGAGEYVVGELMLVLLIPLLLLYVFIVTLILFFNF